MPASHRLRMIFEITHRTTYKYTQPASEAYLELRLGPPHEPGLEILWHKISCSPEAPMTSYEDYFGNRVHFYSMTLRHQKLEITNHLIAKTAPRPLPHAALNLTVAEARQIFGSRLPDIFDYIQPTPVVPVGGIAKAWGTKWFRGHAVLGEALERLNSTIHNHFKYVPGSTDNQTPLAEVWKNKRGVCQDFAHIMLSVLRTCGIPSRYVCGYIDPAPPQKTPDAKGFVGAAYTHAWVEVQVPGGNWVGLDPTNNCWCHQQHIPIARGRDFREAAPVAGTFKASGTQKLSAKVLVRRLSPKQATQRLETLAALKTPLPTPSQKPDSPPTL